MNEKKAPVVVAPDHVRRADPPRDRRQFVDSTRRLDLVRHGGDETVEVADRPHGLEPAREGAIGDLHRDQHGGDARLAEQRVEDAGGAHLDNRVADHGIEAGRARDGQRQSQFAFRHLSILPVARAV